MNTRTVLAALSLAVVAAMAFSACARRQSSPETAQNVLPRAEPPFGGEIGRTPKDSTPDFPKGVEAPPGAHTLVYDFKYDGGGLGKGGVGTIQVDGTTVTTGRIRRETGAALLTWELKLTGTQS